MAFNNTTFQIFTQHLGNADAATYIGAEGEIFYDPNFGVLKLSDGLTPGGVAITTGAGGSFDPTAYYTRAAVDGLFSQLVGTADTQGDTLGELQAKVDSKLDLAGGTLTGPVYYAPTPIGAAELTNKNYVDSKVASSLSTALAALNTDQVAEGSLNLYFTSARADANFSANIAQAVKTPGLVRSVNGIAPDTTGAVALSLTTTITGDLVSQPASADDGTLYVIVGDTDANNDGRSFVWANTSLTWIELAPADTATNDARYIKASGDTMAGPLSLAADPATALEATTKQYVDAITYVLDDLTDANTAAAVAGQSLVYDGAEWIPSTPAARLGDLLDVSNTAPGTGFVLGWDVANNEWQPISSSAAPTLAALLDTDVADANAPTEGATLVYNANTAFWETQPKGETVTPLLPAGGHGWGRFHAYGTQLLRAGSNGNARVHGWGETSDTYMSKPVGVNVEVTGWKKIWEGVSYEYALSEEGWLFTAGYDEAGAQGTGSWTGRPIKDSHSNFIRNESPEIFGPGIVVVDVWSQYKTASESVTGSGSLWVHVNDNGTPKTYAAGYNPYGALGLGAAITTNQGSLIEITELNGKNVISLHCHSYTMMLVTDTGEVWGAGYNGNGVLGIGSSANSQAQLLQSEQASGPITDAKDTVVEFVTSVGTTGFVLLNDGRVLSCGSNIEGSLGSGVTGGADRQYFAEVLTAAGTPITDIQRIWGAGRGQVFMLNSVGEVWATGRNHDGVFGNSAYPIYIANEYAVKVQDNIENLWITSGNRHGWITAHWLKTDGTMWASGADTNYVLGNADDSGADTKNELAPFFLPNGEKIVQHVQLGGITDSNAGYIGVAVVSDAGNHYLWGKTDIPCMMDGMGPYIKYPTLLNDYLPASTSVVRKEIVQYSTPLQAEHTSLSFFTSVGIITDTASRVQLTTPAVQDNTGLWNSATNGIDLKAGVAYEFDMQVTSDKATGVEALDISAGFVDGAGNVIGNPATVIATTYSTKPLARNGVSSFIYTPTSDITLFPTVTYCSTDGALISAYVQVKAISGQLPVSAIELNDISDVDAATPVDGQLLTYENGKWVSKELVPDTATTATKVTGQWTLTPGVNNVSFSVPFNKMVNAFVLGNIPNGIITYQATIIVTNSNVNALGNQYAWNYEATPGSAVIKITSAPDQIIGTNGTILSGDGFFGAGDSSVLNFTIENNSGADCVVDYGYVTLS